VTLNFHCQSKVIDQTGHKYSELAGGQRSMRVSLIT